ncbi:RNA polymerase sigma factor [Longimicrobium sp.]|jgi:RNA polymerase sigma-70 factor (ECF subfamily)|uniref:RNA polymerase sigma factor n=1 Tax=Longimicrobium sp. TaxID=2029185 RepID=UPI002EDB620F
MSPADRGGAGEIPWLVLRAQAGDRAALERLLSHAHALLHPFTRVMLRDEDAADDVLQDVLVLLYRKLGTLRDPRAFSAWARRIASRQIFRDLRRHRKYEAAHEELSPDLPGTAHEPALDPGWVERLPALLERVSPASRAVLALHYLDDLTLDEVATVLEIPPGTAKSRLAYGLATLRKLVSSPAMPRPGQGV